MLEAALVRLRPDGRPPWRKRYGWYRLYSSSGLEPANPFGSYPIGIP
jgi:hypothetical protein